MRATMKPKVFISYSWTSSKFQGQVRDWATRLASDGVEVLLDQFDLKEGQDKYAYMERMVTDASVTHVLVLSDKAYSEKANARKAGVGTESQIISKEVYEKVEQSKFIPVVCERSPDGEVYLPAFLGSRIWVDFSSEEAVNENWEKLIRLLYGKPLYEKPKTGTAPAYITQADAAPANPAAGKFSVFKQALLHGSKGLKVYRRDFLDACIAYADALRVRTQPDFEKLSQQIVDDFRKLIPIRNLVVDWVLLEAETQPSEEFQDSLVEFLERLPILKTRPEELGAYNDVWFDAHALFVFETFLYVVAALLRAGAFKVLNAVLFGSYLIVEKHSNDRFADFSEFYAYVETIHTALGQKYYSAAAELLKRNAERRDITFDSVKEADALAAVAAILKGTQWYPQTHYYWGYGSKFPFFMRAVQRRNFVKLGTVLGVPSGDKLRELLAQQMDQLTNGGFRRVSVDEMIKLKDLDTIN